VLSRFTLSEMMQGTVVDLACIRTACAPMARAIALACALGLSGCAVGPNFTRPTPPSAARYTANTLRGEGGSASDTVQHFALGREIAGDWWTLFRSEAIASIVSKAVEQNRSLEASIATLEQAHDLALAPAGSQFPQVGLTAGVGRQQYGSEFLGGLGKIPPFTYFAVGPSVSYTLDYTGGVARGVERQYALVDVAQHELDAAYLAVTGQAVMQTLAIASARAQIATVETILAQDRDNLRLVQTAFDNGSPCAVGGARPSAGERTSARGRFGSNHPAARGACQPAFRACPSPARHPCRGGATACGDQRRGRRAIEPLSKDSTERRGGTAITRSEPAI